MTFQSKSFLQQQVRSMVGFLKYLGEGKWNLKDFKKAFLNQKKEQCVLLLHQQIHGLYLKKFINIYLKLYLKQVKFFPFKFFDDCL